MGPLLRALPVADCDAAATARAEATVLKKQAPLGLTRIRRSPLSPPGLCLLSPAASSPGRPYPHRHTGLEHGPQVATVAQHPAGRAVPGARGAVRLVLCDVLRGPHLRAAHLARMGRCDDAGAVDGTAASLWPHDADVAAAWLIFAAVLSPLLLPMVREARLRLWCPTPTEPGTLSRSAGLRDPPGIPSLVGELGARSDKAFTSGISEHPVFVGFTALVLAGLGLGASLGRSQTAAGRPGSRAVHIPPGYLAAGAGGLLRAGPGAPPARHGRLRCCRAGASLALPYAWWSGTSPLWRSPAPSVALM